MAKKPHKHYPNAPIVEATIQINFLMTAAGKPPLELWAQVAKKLGEAYPSSKPISAQFQELSFGAAPAFTMRQDNIGLRLERPAQGYIVQLRTDPGALTSAASITKLAPYETWEPFEEEAKAMWAAVVGTKRVGKITRLAVRYVNRIDFDGKAPIDMEKSFNIRPNLPKALKAKVQHFRSELAFRIPENIDCILRQQPMPSPDPSKQGILFDLDVQLKSKVPASAKAMWLALRRLRDAKNSVFEAGITATQKKKFL